MFTTLLDAVCRVYKVYEPYADLNKNCQNIVSGLSLEKTLRSDKSG